jgi:predicted dithiol-disulfide oxidoreductase (DUF899 family)
MATTTSHAPTPSTVTVAEFRTARASLLVQEKAATKLLTSLAAQRRALPRVLVSNISVPRFTSAPGTQLSLSDLFEGRQQLIMYHFMLPASSTNPMGCPSCSFFCDHIPSGPALKHIHSKSVTFCCVAPGPIENVNTWRERMGWTFPFYSAPDLFKAEEEAGEEVSWKPSNRFFGLEVFVKEADGNVYHTYETSSRGVESVLGTYALLDMTPYGRREEKGEEGEMRYPFKLKDEY